MNLSTLAKSVDLTPQTISQYEHSRSTPSDAAVITRIATTLNFPVDFFYEDVADEVPIDAASFRSLARMTKSQARATRATGQFCVTFCGWMAERFHLPRVDVPDVDGKRSRRRRGPSF